MNTIYSLHRVMISENLIFIYQGDFSQETVKRLLALGEQTLEAAVCDPVVRRKVFNVMMESLQNIARHSEKGAETQRAFPAIFLVGREPDGYSVMSGNPIETNRVSELRRSLRQVNDLDESGLKHLYRDIIQGRSLSEKGGAGLGFVDMARKSGSKLSFDFQELSDSHCFFCLKVNIRMKS